jgi:hypothetical protein
LTTIRLLLTDAKGRDTTARRRRGSGAACVGRSQYVLPGNTLKVFVLL